jgi:hypothetical protein
MLVLTSTAPEKPQSLGEVASFVHLWLHYCIAHVGTELPDLAKFRDSTAVQKLPQLNHKQFPVEATSKSCLECLTVTCAPGFSPPETVPFHKGQPHLPQSTCSKHASTAEAAIDKIHGAFHHKNQAAITAWGGPVALTPRH